MKNFQTTVTALLACAAFGGITVPAHAQSSGNRQAPAQQAGATSDRANTAGATGPQATASDTAAAEKFLRGVYAHYRESKSPAPEIKDEDIYDAPLLALMDADSKAADGEVGYLDGDPMCDCQDYDIRDVRIGFAPAGSGQLKATVSMLNFGERKTINLLLHKTAKGWRVADVIGADGSLSDGLRQSTADMLAEKTKSQGQK